jgi:NADH-quinone oxidoreductase subunit K
MFFSNTNYTYIFSNIDLKLPIFICFSFCLFIIGFLGLILNNRNMIVILLSLEIIALSLSLKYVFLAVFFGNLFAYSVVLIIMAIAAAESAIGLSLLVVYYRIRKNLSVIKISHMFG